MFRLERLVDNHISGAVRRASSWRVLLADSQCSLHAGRHAMTELCNQRVWPFGGCSVWNIAVSSRCQPPYVERGGDTTRDNDARRYEQGRTAATQRGDTQLPTHTRTHTYWPAAQLPTCTISIHCRHSTRPLLAAGHRTSTSQLDSPHSPLTLSKRLTQPLHSQHLTAQHAVRASHRTTSLPLTCTTPLQQAILRFLPHTHFDSA